MFANNLSVELVEVLVRAVQPGGVVGDHLERANVALDLSVFLYDLLYPLFFRLRRKQFPCYFFYFFGFTTTSSYELGLN